MVVAAPRQRTLAGSGRLPPAHVGQAGGGPELTFAFPETAVNPFPVLFNVGLAVALPSAASGLSAAGGGALEADSAIDLRVTVPNMLELRLLDHPQSLQIDAADAAKGEVLVSGARIELLSNLRRGYVVQASIGGPVSEALIEGLPQEMKVSASGARVTMPSMVGSARPQPFQVLYRLRLRTGTSPGTYAWPVALSLEAP